MMLLNFLSLFIIMGIGADDVFIFTDLWVQSMATEDDYADRLITTYKRATGAMAITTATTAASFFANLASSIVPIREFGTYMGLVVAFNFLTVITIYPFSLVVLDRIPRWGCFQCCCPKESTDVVASRGDGRPGLQRTGTAGGSFMEGSQRFFQNVGSFIERTGLVLEGPGGHLQTGRRDMSEIRAGLARNNGSFHGTGGSFRMNNPMLEESPEEILARRVEQVTRTTGVSAAVGARMLAEHNNDPIAAINAILDEGLHAAGYSETDALKSTGSFRDAVNAFSGRTGGGPAVAVAAAAVAEPVGDGDVEEAIILTGEVLSDSGAGAAKRSTSPRVASDSEDSASGAAVGGAVGGTVSAAAGAPPPRVAGDTSRSRGGSAATSATARSGTHGRLATFVKAITPADLDVIELSPDSGWRATEIFFHNKFSPFVRRWRLYFILLLGALGGYSMSVPFTHLTPSDELPRFFEDSKNMGLINSVLREFEFADSLDDDALVTPPVVQNCNEGAQGNLCVDPACPGLVSSTGEYCSGSDRGRCCDSANQLLYPGNNPASPTQGQGLCGDKAVFECSCYGRYEPPSCATLAPVDVAFSVLSNSECPCNDLAAFKQSIADMFGVDVNDITDFTVECDDCRRRRALGDDAHVVRRDLAGTSTVTFTIRPQSSAEGNQAQAAAEGLSTGDPIPGTTYTVSTRAPTASPTKNPTRSPSNSPPTPEPTAGPTPSPVPPTTKGPSLAPTRAPSRSPTTPVPTSSPTTAQPTANPTQNPTGAPSTPVPSNNPTKAPTRAPTRRPTNSPGAAPTPPTTNAPSLNPTGAPSKNPSKAPTKTPTANPTPPTNAPSTNPTRNPTRAPSKAPTAGPSANPTTAPTVPTQGPTANPTTAPSKAPSRTPTTAPSKGPTRSPTTPTTTAPTPPTRAPTTNPTKAPTACTLNCVHGSCVVGTCQCDEGYKGGQCDVAACPGYSPVEAQDNECNGVGDCTDGVCVCQPNYSGPSCGNYTEPELSDSETILVSNVFGLAGLDRYDKEANTLGAPVYDANFPPFVRTRQGQQAMLAACALFCLSSNDDSLDRCKLSPFDKLGGGDEEKYFGPDLIRVSATDASTIKLRRLSNCMFADFVTWAELEGFVFPFPENQFDEIFDLFLAGELGGTANTVWRSYGFVARDLTAGPSSGRMLVQTGGYPMLWWRFEVQSGVDGSAGSTTLGAFYKSWEDLSVKYNDNIEAIVAAANAGKSPGDAGYVPFSGMTMVSSQFARAETENAAVAGTISSMMISIGCAFIAILLFTGNALIAIYTIVTIVLIVADLMLFMLVILGWKFGAIEAISVTVFVGFSVDYVLHIANSYNEAKIEPTRFLKTRAALTQTGVSVSGAAVTTIGASIFLFFADIVAFKAFGIVICANTFLSITYCFLFFCPVLM